MTEKISFKGKKVIIFDLDGTLVNLNVNWRELKDTLNSRYSKIYDEADCQFNSISRCLSFIVDQDDEAELNNFFQIIRKHELGGIKGSEINEKAVSFIKNLEKFGLEDGVEFAVFSLNTRDCVKEALDLANIREKIDYIVGREDVRKWKPNPEGLLKIQEHYNLKKEEMIYIGDMAKDIEAGKRAGVKTCWIEDLNDLVEKTLG